MPNPLAFSFFGEAIGLPGPFRKAVVERLIAIPCNHPAVIEHDPRLAAKSLALALALDPESRQAAAANRALATGATPTPVKGIDAGAIQLLFQIWEIGLQMERRARNDDERLFALYLQEMILKAVPKEAPEATRLRNHSLPENFPGWDRILPE